MVVVVVMVGWLARCSQYTAAAAAGVVFAWSIAQSQLFDWFAANDNSPAFAIALRCVPVCLCLCLCLCLCVCVCVLVNSKPHVPLHVAGVHGHVIQELFAANLVALLPVGR